MKFKILENSQQMNCFFLSFNYFAFLIFCLTSSRCFSTCFFPEHSTLTGQNEVSTYDNQTHEILRKFSLLTFFMRFAVKSSCGLLTNSTFYEWIFNLKKFKWNSCFYWLDCGLFRFLKLREHSRESAFLFLLWLRLCSGLFIPLDDSISWCRWWWFSSRKCLKETVGTENVKNCLLILSSCQTLSHIVPPSRWFLLTVWMCDSKQFFRIFSPHWLRRTNGHLKIKSLQLRCDVIHSHKSPRCSKFITKSTAHEMDGKRKEYDLNWFHI